MKLQYEFHMAGSRKKAEDPSPQRKMISYYEELLKKVRKENA